MATVVVVMPPVGVRALRTEELEGLRALRDNRGRASVVDGLLNDRHDPGLEALRGLVAADAALGGEVGDDLVLRRGLAVAAEAGARETALARVRVGGRGVLGAGVEDLRRRVEVGDLLRRGD